MENLDFVHKLGLMHIHNGTFVYEYADCVYHIYVNGSRWIGALSHYNPSLVTHQTAFLAVMDAIRDNNSLWGSYPDQVYINDKWFLMDDKEIEIELFTKFCRGNYENIS